MDKAIEVVNYLGNIGAALGLGWIAWGVYDLIVGIKRELDEKKDKGLTSILLGGVAGTILKSIFAALAALLQGFQ